MGLILDWRSQAGPRRLPGLPARWVGKSALILDLPSRGRFPADSSLFAHGVRKSRVEAGKSRVKAPLIALAYKGQADPLPEFFLGPYQKLIANEVRGGGSLRSGNRDGLVPLLWSRPTSAGRTPSGAAGHRLPAGSFACSRTPPGMPSPSWTSPSPGLSPGAKCADRSPRSA